MITVYYELEFNYRPLNLHPSATNDPAVALTLIGPSGTEHDTVALVDSGAKACLFKAELGNAIGIENILSGERDLCWGLGGGSVTAYFHRIRVRINGSEFAIDAGFTMDNVAQNILGRTFLEHVQFGLRDHHQKIYLTPKP